MGKNHSTRVQGAPFQIIFTDLDGTLLDNQTYEWEDAIPALSICKHLDIPVILVSSKTRAEMDRLRTKLSIYAPFISENGGGIFFPSEISGTLPPGTSLDGNMWKLSLGLPYGTLVRKLQEIRKELGLNIKGFSDMSIREISRLTGLNMENSQLAAMREYDEPFLILDKKPLDREAIVRAATHRGLTITEGGRFFHIHGNNNKGLAVDKVASWYKELHGNIFSIVLGDSPNDFPMLERADCAILVKSQSDFSEMKKKIPRLKITQEMGPKGWNSAVLDILKMSSERIPRSLPTGA
jgi:mannosyl-3-phosphoglycerate phosphatase